MDPTQQSDRQSYRPIVLGHARNDALPAKFVLVLHAYLSLIRFDLYLARKDFKALYSKVRKYPIGGNPVSRDRIEPICSAVDAACIWYCKEVRCLQRSAVTTCLLRRYGIAAHMVIGAQQMPFKAHAWVEVGSRVVNDKEYVPKTYATLDRC